METSMKRNLNHLYALGAMLGLALAVSPASAAGIQDVVDNVTGQIGSVKTVIAATSFIGGLVLGFGGIMKFLEHSKNPMQVKLSEGMWRLGVGVALIALPQVLGVGIGTLFDSASMVDAGGGGLDSLSVQ
jgi:hypothetical protein